MSGPVEVDKSTIESHYNEEYYKDQVDSSLQSARIVLPHAWKYLRPNSVADFGCGRGPWLQAWRELGATELIGLDGHWNNQAAMCDQHIQFRQVDLTKPVSIEKRVDVAMSVEVAEHLMPASSDTFIDSLTRASDAVVFGAAFVKQNGPTHINERLHSFWGQLFQDRGYKVFDVFRPHTWGDSRVFFWYRQNTFLYVKQDSTPYQSLKAAGLTELPNVGFLDCVHPDLFRLRTTGLAFSDHVRELIPSFRRAMQRRFGG